MTTGPDHLEEFTPYLMNRIMARYNKGVEEALKEVGITVAQMRALAVLTESGPCTINTLSVLTVIKQSTLSRTLDTMETAGLIRREADSKDSRIRHIQLTDTGRHVHETAWLSHAADAGGHAVRALPRRQKDDERSAAARVLQHPPARFLKGPPRPCPHKGRIHATCIAHVAKFSDMEALRQRVVPFRCRSVRPKETTHG